MRKMLKHIGMPIAVASIAVIVVLAWTMILSPAQAAAQSAQEARAYITVEIRTGDDSVSWSDLDECPSGYNIYLVVTTASPRFQHGPNHPYTPCFCCFRHHTGDFADLHQQR